MDKELTKRWNQIKDKLLSEDLLNNLGLGNEIGFYIFDYLPEFELGVRNELPTLLSQIQNQRKDLNIVHINLFDFILGYLKERKLLTTAFDFQKKKGDQALLKALDGPLRAEKIAAKLKTVVENADLLLMSGVGSVWPIFRTHTLLSALHPVMGQTPLVMFYPGSYDGQELRLFNKFPKNYYRAFKLIP